MKKTFKYIACALLTLGITSSCTKDFESINKDPNKSSEPNTALFLSNAIRHLGNQPSGIGGWTKDIYPQYYAEIQYTNESVFQNKFYDFTPFYRGPLMDLQTIYNLNSNDATANLSYVQAGGFRANQLAVSRILKAFYYMHITDRWGMIPYTDALQGLTKLSPKYDNQQDIYNSLFTELKEASTQINTAEPINGDILFGGNMQMWKKWANTLRMVAAIHISQVDPTKAKAEFTSAMNDGVLTSNADNVYFKYLTDANNQNPLYNNYFVTKRKDYAVSEKTVNTLTSLKDPRLPVYAEKTVRTDAYVGMPYGLPTSDSRYSIETVSLIGNKFSAQNYALPLTTYAQVQFMLAEAAFRGWITGDPATFYTAGITASMSQQGVLAPATYFTQEGVAYQAAKGLELIINQKWIANFSANGYESWVDWRRTGFPVLNPGPAPLSIHKGIPYRHAYPNTEQGLNGINYKAAVDAQGPDEVNTKVWWDKD